MQGAGGLIGETRGGTSKYYHADALGTTRAITNSSQTKTDSLDTDAFGMSVAVTGSTPTPFGFAGQHGYQNDSVTGLMRLGHRYYDASVGRFLSRDLIQDGYNWYAYCNNDPVNGVDPEGLMVLELAVGVIAFPEIAIPVIIVIGIGIGIGAIIIGIGHAIDYFNQPNYANDNEGDDTYADDHDTKERERRRRRGDGGAKNDDYLFPKDKEARRGAHKELDKTPGIYRNPNVPRSEIEEGSEDWDGRGRTWKREKKR
jgi:RHS repeat-associated protein